MTSPARDAANHMFEWLVRVPLALVLATLPRRWWEWFDAVAPISPAIAAASAFVTIVAAAFTGAFGYLLYLFGEGRVFSEAAGSSGAAFTPFAFAFGTPQGLAAIYFLVSGVYRGWAAWFDEPVGDPLLTALDNAILKRRARAAARRQQHEREALEGPAVPDRLLEGAAAGFPDADLVVVAARRKPEWTKGTFVVTADRWYRLHEPVERTLPFGLRTFYPMSEVKDLEARRRWVEYELPPLTGSAKAKT